MNFEVQYKVQFVRSPLSSDNGVCQPVFDR